jgi:hypothetical protein
MEGPGTERQPRSYVMSTEENKAITRRFLDEVANGGNVAVLDDLYGPNFVDHSVPPGVPRTTEAAKGFWTASGLG